MNEEYGPDGIAGAGFEISVPGRPREVVTHWGICSPGGRPFGESLEWEIEILAAE